MGVSCASLISRGCWSCRLTGALSTESLWSPVPSPRWNSRCSPPKRASGTCSVVFRDTADRDIGGRGWWLGRGTSGTWSSGCGATRRRTKPGSFSSYQSRSPARSPPLPRRPGSRLLVTPIRPRWPAPAVAAHGRASVEPVRARLVRRRIRRAGVHRLLAHREIQRNGRHGRLHLLRRRALADRLVSHCSTTHRSLRAPEHDGVHAPAVECAPDVHPARTESRGRGRVCCSLAPCCRRWTYRPARRT